MAKNTKPKTAKKSAATVKSKNSNKKVIIIISVIVAIFFVIPAILFGLFIAFISNQVANSPAKDINISSKEGVYEVKDKDGNSYSTGTNQKLSKDFPTSQISLYKGTTTSVSRISSNGKTTWMVTRQTSDNNEKISSNIKSTLDKMGWTIETEYSTGNGSGISATKEGYDAVIIYATQDDGITNISYTISQK